MKTRTEKEMFELINNFIERDERIRLAILNGSRANPKVKKDIFQDYDIACFVTDLKPFLVADEVLPYFGQAMVVEEPNYGPWPPDDADGSYHNYNIQLLDGNRIDLSFFELTWIEEKCKDSLSEVLIDKDGRVGALPPADDSSYFIPELSEDKYLGCCNAFFFALGSHLPKNLWRNHLPLVKAYLEGWLRVPTNLMLSWEVGLKSGFDQSMGAGHKYFEESLEKETWEKYKRTYVGADFDELWEAVFTFYDLFEEAARFVAAERGYSFPADTGNKVLAFLKHVKTMPRDARTIY